MVELQPQRRNALPHLEGLVAAVPLAARLGHNVAHGLALVAVWVILAPPKTRAVQEEQGGVGVVLQQALHPHVGAALHGTNGVIEPVRGQAVVACKCEPAKLHFSADVPVGAHTMAVRAAAALDSSWPPCPPT